MPKVSSRGNIRFVLDRDTLGPAFFANDNFTVLEAQGVVSDVLAYEIDLNVNEVSARRMLEDENSDAESIY